MKDISSQRTDRICRKDNGDMSEYERAEDLINIGAYTPGNNQRIDYAISMIDKVKTFLAQGIDDRVTIEETQNSMKILFYV